MTQRCYDFGYSDWKFGTRCQRLSWVAGQPNEWIWPRDCRELYAWEAGPLWKF